MNQAFAEDLGVVVAGETGARLKWILYALQCSDFRVLQRMDCIIGNSYYFTVASSAEIMLHVIIISCS